MKRESFGYKEEMLEIEGQISYATQSSRQKVNISAIRCWGKSNSTYVSMRILGCRLSDLIALDF
jgi:hypothetical protein